jgi:hypothetical protein
VFNCARWKYGDLGQHRYFRFGLVAGFHAVQLEVMYAAISALDICDLTAPKLPLAGSYRLAAM